MKKKSTASGSGRKDLKPKQILLSKRANIFYLDKVRVMQKDERIVYLTQTNSEIQQYFNIPERNTALLLLGKGSSITDSAARKLAESNVLVGFCGSGGTPLFSSVDLAFLTPHSEYGPTEYMQAWGKKWFDESSRLRMAQKLVEIRVELCRTFWSKDLSLISKMVLTPESKAQAFLSRSHSARNSQDILLAEALWVKSLYNIVATAYQVEFIRDHDLTNDAAETVKINAFLNHGNYLAYGLAAVVLNALGISYCFPLLHGKTRRGALVFDIADLIKDGIVLPLAFEVGINPKSTEKDFRSELIEKLQSTNSLDVLFDSVKKIAEMQ
jgi:CRISPR-associated protein Cas1